MSAGSSLVFERLESVYRVPRDAPVADARERLDGIARDGFARAFAQLHSATFDADADAVCVVRTLDVELDLDLATGDEDAARTWAASAGSALADALAHAGGDRVARFADRAEQLASFLAALARGRAWGSWVHAPFEGLSTLPAGTAVTEALCRAPDDAAAALERLAHDGRLDAVLALLGDADGRRVLGLLEPAQADGNRAVPALRRTGHAELKGTYRRGTPTRPDEREPARSRDDRTSVGEHEPAHNRDGETGVQALTDVVASLLGACDLPTERAGVLARVLAGERGLPGPSSLPTLLVECIEECSAFLADPGRETATALVQALRAAGTRRRDDRRMRRSVVERLLLVHPSPWSVASRAADAATAVRVALAFRAAGDEVPPPALLVAAASALGELAEAPAAAGAAGQALTAARAWLREAADGDDAWLERVIREVDERARAPSRVSGLPARADTSPPPRRSARADTRSTAAAAPDETATAYGGIFLLLPGLAELAAAHADALPRALILLKCIGRARLDTAAADPVVALAAGLDSALEIDALIDVSVPRPGRVAADLAFESRARGSAAVVELVEGALLVRDAATDYWLHAGPSDEDATAAVATALELLRAAGLPLETVLLRGEAAAAVDGRALDAQIAVAGEPLFADWLRRARPAGPELEHLSLAPPLARGDDLAWTPAAVAVLRSFGARLAGFGWSGAAHLWDNVLAGTSLVSVRPGLIEVELPLVPLDVLLRLAGVDGRTYTVPWLPDHEIRLRLPPS